MSSNRSSLSAYIRTLNEMTFDELHKEVWLLEEHVRHLKQTSQDADKISQFCSMIEAAKKEKERRAFDKGYI